MPASPKKEGEQKCSPFFVLDAQVSTDQETGEYYFSEIAQPYKVDSLRATIGMPPLQTYADNWSFKWDPEKHIARHRAVEEK